MKKIVVLLDMDGVILPLHHDWIKYGIPKDKMDFLKNWSEDLPIVISSCWRSLGIDVIS